MRRLVVLTIVLLVAGSAKSHDLHKDACNQITRSNLVNCVLIASLKTRENDAAVEAIRGRQDAVSAWLPSNPILSLAGAQREGPGGNATFTNWYVTLAQELEIAGQQVVRGEAVGLELRAQQERHQALQRDIAAQAWRVYFEAVAASEGLILAHKLETIHAHIAEVTHTRVTQGLNAQVDASLADASKIRATQLRMEAEHTQHTALAMLHMLYGRDPLSKLLDMQAGTLTPLHIAEKLSQNTSAIAFLDQPEVEALYSDQRAYETHAAAFRRARIPNPTLSGFVQKDGFNETVLGLGLSFPVTLPHPIGRSYSGEETQALARSKELSLERQEQIRAQRLELSTARMEFFTRQRQVEEFAPELIKQTHSTLDAIAEEIQRGHLAARDALSLHQKLVDVLLNDVSTRLALALASVRLARAAGVALEKGIQ